MAVDDVLELIVIDLSSPPADEEPRDAALAAIAGQSDSHIESAGTDAEALVPFPAVTGLGALAWQLSLRQPLTTTVTDQSGGLLQPVGQCGIMVAPRCDLEAPALSTPGRGKNRVMRTTDVAFKGGASR